MPITAAFGPGAYVSGYRLEEQIGRGGMAVVFRALDVRLNRQVALKLMAPGQSVNDAFRRRFMMESQAAASVDDPHIIPVYQAGEADGVLFIAMRLVRGGDLKTLVSQHGPLSPARVGRIVTDVASALDAAHTHGLVHRDVKPANMLLDARPGRPDHVYLSDFGVSKAALEPSGLTGSGQFLGTVDYVAPEQIHGRSVDGRVDQYALGCAAYELLCGRPPFAGRELLAAMYAQLSEPAPAPSSVRAGLPPAVDEVFARVLAKSPGDRYESCQDFAGALRAALGVRGHDGDRLADAANGSAPVPGDGDDVTLDPALARGLPFTAGAAMGTARPGGSLTLERPATGDDTLPGLGRADGTGPWAGSGGRSGRVPPARKALAAMTAFVLVLAGVAAAILLSGHSPAVATPYPFHRASYPGDLAIAQRWELEGSRGTVLDVKITAFNTSAEPVAAQLEEPIPTAIAESMKKVTFLGLKPRVPLANSRVVVVVWSLNLRAHGQEVVRYKVREPANGDTEARLRQLVSAFKPWLRQQALQRVKPGSPVQYLAITPAVTQLQVGGSAPLTLSGLTPKGKKVRRAELTKAKWSVSPSGVALVLNGRVYGLQPGRARVTAKIGHVTASAIVIVSAAGQPGPVLSSPTPGQSSLSSSISPTTSTSVSPSTSTSASGSPSPSTSTSPSSSTSDSPSPTPS